MAATVARRPYLPGGLQVLSEHLLRCDLLGARLQHRLVLLVQGPTGWPAASSCSVGMLHIAAQLKTVISVGGRLARVN